MHRQAHFADFVEENGPAVGDLEQSLLVLIGACERAFHITEELRLEQRFGKGSAIDGYERLTITLGAGVHGTGDQFLTGPTLPVNQNRAAS